MWLGSKGRHSIYGCTFGWIDNCDGPTRLTGLVPYLSALEMSIIHIIKHYTTTPHHNHLRPFFRDHPGEPVTEENFWTLWCKGRLIEVDTPAIRLDTTPPGLTSAHFHHPAIFLQAGCPSCRPTNSVKALKAIYKYPVYFSLVPLSPTSIIILISVTGR